MSKLHELLAVEGDLKSQAEATRKDLKNTFEKKTHHFSKKVVTFKPKTEGAADKVESQLALQSTVHKELAWISEKLAKAMDAGHQIDVANTMATADVILEDGTTILLHNVPATSLLRMEHRIIEIRDLVHAIPTLDPAKGFLMDPSEQFGIYRARDDERPRTEKQFDFVVMVGPTDKHPAQTKELMLDKPIGVVITQEWSSAITVQEKGDMLDRVEELLRAVKRALARANEFQVKVEDYKIGRTVLKYVFDGAK
jgi:hypothetical protein